MKVLLFVLRFLIRRVKNSGIRKGYEVSGIREYGTEKSVAKKNSTGGGRCRQQLFAVKDIVRERCNLLWAKNGEDAVNQFKEHQPDLILMDIKMPHMDGLEATRLIRSYSKEVPIVALTAFAFESDKDRAIEAGCDDFLTKPVSQNALEKVLDKYVK